MTPNNALKGKQLHPDVSKQVNHRFESRFFDDAVFAAFKVVENRMRDLVGPADGTPLQVINEAWNPTAGKLHRPKVAKPDREACFHLFRGAFSYFRNPVVHRFMELSEDEAFDQIILANRLLLIVEESIQELARILGQPTESLSPLHDEANMPIHPDYGRSDYTTARQFFIDVTGDNHKDLVILTSVQSEARINVVDGATGRQIKVDSSEVAMPLFDSVMTLDVDSDGRPELVVSGRWDNDQGIVIYKYVNDELLLLRKDTDSSLLVGTGESFIMAYATDFDGDKRLEIVEEPWMAVPSSLLPNDDFAKDYGWGRVRYVWKWDGNRSTFRLVRRELARMGPRFV